MHNHSRIHRLAITLFAAGAALVQLSVAYAVDVTTYHYNPQRTGLNNAETVLTPAAVGSAAFQKLKTVSLGTEMASQPLVVSAATLASWGYASKFPNDVVYLADQGNNVFAVDSVTGAILLQKNFGTPVANANLPGGCPNSAASVGISSTPVIDPTAKVMYFVTYTWESGAAVYRIHELSLVNFTEVIPSVVVTANGTLSDGSQVSFVPGSQHQRPALLLANGNIYAAFGSFCDYNANTTRGWVIGWSAGTLKPLAHAELTQQQIASQSVAPPAYGVPPPFYLSSIWMSGYGVAADAAGALYFQTGNSDGSKANNLPDSVVHMSSDLSTVTDYFTPSNFAALDSADTDRGSGGVLVVPNLANGTQLAVSHGKDGRLFLHNRGNLGQYVANGPDVPSNVLAGPCWCGPGYYVGADSLPRIVSTGGNQIETWLVPTSATGALSLDSIGPALPSLDGEDPGFMTSTSSNGTVANSSVIWSVSRSSAGVVYLQALSGTPIYQDNAVVKDKAGNQWSFSTQRNQGNALTLLNGSAANGGAAAQMVVDWQGTLWAMNSQQSWFSWSGSGWSGQTGSPAIPSPAGLSLTPGAANALTDASGRVWSFGAAVDANNARILLNGAPSPSGGAGAKMIIDTAGVLWALNSNGSWFFYNASGWASNGTTGPNFSITSKPGAIVTPVTGGELVDNAKRIFSFGSQESGANNRIFLNGSASPNGGAGAKMVIDNSGVMWTINSAGEWWSYGSGGWVPHGTATGPTLPAWTPGAMLSAGSGFLPQLQLVAAGNWGIYNTNANLVPTVANGKVYVASYGQLTIWGLAN
jgi:hypothetical protein